MSSLAPMEVLTTSIPARASPTGPGTVVTIGAYDGVHLGHRAVIAQVRTLAAERGLQTAVVTFDRHPAAVVRPDSAPQLLTDLDQKLELLAATGVDYTLVVHFDEERSKESAEDFVREVLVGCLGARAVVVGEDFHFGHRRQGNVALLTAMGGRARLRGHRPRPGGPRRRARPRGRPGLVHRHPRGARRRATCAGPTPCWAGPTRCGAPSATVTSGLASWASRTANVAVPDEICLPADGIYAGWYLRPDGGGPPRRALARAPARPSTTTRRHVAARGPPARLRRRSLRRAGAGSGSWPGCATSSSSTRSTRSSPRWAVTATRPEHLLAPLEPGGMSRSGHLA